MNAPITNNLTQALTGVVDWFRLKFLDSVYLFVILIVTTYACGGSNTGPTRTPAPQAATSIPPTVTSLAISGGGCSNGGTCTAPGNFMLATTATLSNGTTQVVTSQTVWNSTNPNIAIINGIGMVTVLNVGATNIMAEYQRKLADVTVIVPPHWAHFGTGNSVFDMPSFVSRVRIGGTYAGNSSNFMVRIAGRLAVNELLGTDHPSTTYDGTHIVNGGQVVVSFSSGVNWTFRQIRQ